MIPSVAELVRPGRVTMARAAVRWIVRRALLVHTKGAPRYQPPDEQQLAGIEAGLASLGIECVDYTVAKADLDAFMARFRFPPDYYGGPEDDVHREKLLEHYVAWDLLGLDAGKASYIDVAAFASPWTQMLRAQGIDAHAIDLQVPPQFKELAHYHAGDACNSPFEPGRFAGASLQWAFEMFQGDSDHRLIRELARILSPGGRAVISPLYMHATACQYQSPEYYGRGGTDPGAMVFLRPDCWGVAASRKYSPATLVSRVLNPAREAGLRPSLLVLRNKRELGPAIYLHFILVLDKPATREGYPGDSR